MDIITLALAKKFATSVSAGYSKVEVKGNTIEFTLNDGSNVSLDVPKPKDGVSIVDLEIDEDGSLLCYLSDGTIVDAGHIPTTDPDLTNYYTKEETNQAISDYVDSLNANEVVY